MAELETHRMQSMWFWGTFLPVEGIAQKRVSHVCCVYANLMCASGIKMEGNQTFFCILPKHAVARTGSFSLGRNTSLDDGAFPAGNGLIDESGRFFPMALREGKVKFFHRSLGEHMMECSIFGK